MQNLKPLRIGIVAGEASGDLLGAGLIQALRVLHPNIQIEGIAGPRMIASGCKPLFPMESLAVMGLVEVLGRLPSILRIRKYLYQHFLANPPDVFIGIDAPDFNLTLEQKLKSAGIKTVHYVSPSVWAWRQSRLKKIARAVDLMLTLLPFEERFYVEHHIPVKFVGHPLADTIPLQSDRILARQQFGLKAQDTVVALLPGSRLGEINYLGEAFIRTALKCYAQRPNLIFIAPMINAKRREQFAAITQRIAPQLPLRLLDGEAQLAMTAADVVLLASGTATLEAMLVKRPMVVAYRLSPITYHIVRKLVNVSRIALPNLLSTNQNLVPEFIQKDATPENLSAAVLNYLDHPDLMNQVLTEYTRLHKILQRDASHQAAEAILQLIN